MSKKKKPKTKKKPSKKATFKRKGNDKNFTKAGKFKKGNKMGKGSPYFTRQKELREELLEAATPKKIKAVFDSLFDLATNKKYNDKARVMAAKEYLDRTTGKVVQPQEINLTSPRDQAEIIRQSVYEMNSGKPNGDDK